MTRSLWALPAMSASPRRAHRLRALAAGVLLLAGCSTTDHSGGSGAEPTGTAAADSGQASEADVRFAASMVPHHEQAVQMADLALAREDSRLHELADQVRAAQQPEIEQLQTWLDEWDDAGHMSHGDHDDDSDDEAHEGHGMMTQEQLAQLEETPAEEFDRRWLEMMIEHHEGAVAMAQEHLKEGTHPGARQMARDIIEAQQSEIEQMQALVQEGPAAAATTEAGGEAPMVLPDSHVHGIQVGEGQTVLYLAAHDGLYRYETADPQPERVGPAHDLMGLTQVEGRLLASGHPGPGEDQRNPLGLVESTDGGRSWQQLSRAGTSDFHALAAAPGLVVGFDGRLRVSSDGRQWQDADLDEAVHDLAVSTEGTVLATTADGAYRSSGEALSWERLESSPPLVLVGGAAAGTWIGIDQDGRVHTSKDDGSSWARTGQVEASGIQAMTVVPGRDEGQPAALLVVTDERVVRSTDGGRTFQPFGR